MKSVLLSKPENENMSYFGHLEDNMTANKESNKNKNHFGSGCVDYDIW